MPGLPVHALELGEIVPRSSLGEPFAARIPLQLDAGEEFTSGCVSILPGPDASRGLPLPPGLRASIEIVSGRHYLAIRNARPTNDPVVGLRLEFTCNDLQARDYVVFLSPAMQEPAAGQADPAPMTQAQPGHEAQAVRPRRHKTTPRVRAPKQVEQPKVSETTPADGSYLLRPDFSPIDLLRSTNVSEAQRESLRAVALGNVGLEEAMAKANQHSRKLESEVVALRKELEVTRQAVAVKPAPVSGWNPADLGVNIGKLVVLGVPALIALAGLFAWWRSRRREVALHRDPWKQQPQALKARMEAAADEPQPSEKPAHIHALVPHRAPPLASAAPLAPHPTPAAPPIPVRDLSAILPHEITPIEFEEGAVPGMVDPDPAPTLPELVFNLAEDDYPRAAQEAYFTGRFGGSSEDVKILHDLDTVIEQAHSIFEDDNDPVKAADLLELAAALHPTEVRPLLALFAIYRRASLARQYAILGEKFHNSFPKDSNWPTIQRLGREIDAGNPLYEAAVAAEGANGTASEEASQDVTDRWLDVPLDFTSVLLADELREALTAGDAPNVPLAASRG